MEQVELGRTGVEIPVVGMGTWNYSAGPEPLLAGLDAGAAFIDTAESYGTEAMVGNALKAWGKKAFLATKVSAAHLAPDRLRKAVNSSLLHLGVDCIDLYQIHAPNPAVPIQDTLGAMEDLVDAGKIRHIGVSNFSVNDLKRALAVTRKHRIVSNQIRFNLIDRTHLPELIPYCQSNGITIVAYSPLSRQIQHLRDADPHGVLDGLARETGRTIAQIALNWCLSHPGVCVIPKGSSAEHVVDNCGASGWRLSRDQLQRLNTGIASRRRGWVEQRLRALASGRLRPIVLKFRPLLPPAIRRKLQ